MDITLEHVVASGEVCGDGIAPHDVELTVTVEYDVTYHYDAGGWTDYGGDPPSHSLDINEARVVEWSIGYGGMGVFMQLTKEVVQKLYDLWADKHGDEIEAELFDKIMDGAGEWDGD